MFTNEGTLDRIVRVVVGLVLVSLAFFGPRTPLAWLGLIPLLTGLIGFCPLYRLIATRTNETRLSG